MDRKRRRFRAAPRGAERARTDARERGISAAARRAFARTVICGAVFIVLIALKLVTPDHLTAMRGTLGSWLVRDADFKEAFSALGRTLNGEGGVAEKLGEAYLAVFGGGEDEAAEVSGAAEIPAEAPEAEEKAPEADTLGFAHTPPLPSAVTSPFGWREHPVSGRDSFHYGVDLAAGEGDAVACFADGTVAVVAESTELGKYLTVTHADGCSTLYAHLSRVLVEAGSAVRCGETVGEAGQTGNATGPHLHFELRRGGEYLDPEPYLAETDED